MIHQILIREKFVNQTIQCCFHQKNRFKQEMYTKFLIRTNQAQPRPLYSIPVCTIDSQDSLEFPRLPKYNVIPSRIQIISIESILSSKTSPKMIINQGKENLYPTRVTTLRGRKKEVLWRTSNLKNKNLNHFSLQEKQYR